MTRIGRAIAWFRHISVLAEDEQRRSGHPEIDAEHLLLALVGAGGPVTQSLGRAGVTLESARAAFDEGHRRRLGRLGIAAFADDTGARTIPPGNARGSFRYRPGVRSMLEAASRRPQPDIALFAALTSEPSGHVREALRELGVEPDGLDLTAPDDGLAPRGAPSAAGAEEYRRFVPAAPLDVWQLVSDPARWSEWHPVTGPGDSQGAPRMGRLEAPEWVEWEDRSGRRCPRLLRVRLEPAGSGTIVALSLSGDGRSGSGGRPRGARRWLQRLLLRGQADGISRAIRS